MLSALWKGALVSRYLVKFEPAAIYLPFHPRGNRLIGELVVYAESVEGAEDHGRKVTQGASRVVAEELPEAA